MLICVTGPCWLLLQWKQALCPTCCWYAICFCVWLETTTMRCLMSTKSCVEVSPYWKQELPAFLSSHSARRHSGKRLSISCVTSRLKYLLVNKRLHILYILIKFLLSSKGCNPVTKQLWRRHCRSNSARWRDHCLGSLWWIIWKGTDSRSGHLWGSVCRHKYWGRSHAWDWTPRAAAGGSAVHEGQPDLSPLQSCQQNQDLVWKARDLKDANIQMDACCIKIK